MQRSSPFQISDTPGAGYEPVRNLSSELFEWSSDILHHSVRNMSKDVSATMLYKLYCY